MNPGLVAVLIVGVSYVVIGLLAEHRRQTTDAEAQQRAALTSLSPLSNGWSPRNVIAREDDRR